MPERALLVAVLLLTILGAPSAVAQPEADTPTPDEVLKKLYYKNALRVIPGIDASLFPE